MSRKFNRDLEEELKESEDYGSESEDEQAEQDPSIQVTKKRGRSAVPLAWTRVIHVTA